MTAKRPPALAAERRAKPALGCQSALSCQLAVVLAQVETCAEACRRAERACQQLLTAFAALVA